MSEVLPSPDQLLAHQTAAQSAIDVINHHSRVNEDLASRGLPGLAREFTAMSAAEAALESYREALAGVAATPEPAANLPKIKDLEIEKLVQDVFNEFASFYRRHFRGDGIAISAADQMAFYEIAQPALHDLAVRAQGGSSSGL